MLYSWLFVRSLSMAFIMKPSLILMTHGDFADEILESAKFIVGEIEGAHTVSMAQEDGMDGTRAKLDHVLSAFPPDAELLIITDIPGGTPCNIAIGKLFASGNIRVLSGLNLGMLLEYALSSDEGLDELCASVYDAGMSSIKIIRKPEGGAATIELDE